jgi:hypothetical protein
MIPLFGAHYRMYRLRAALDRLSNMPAGTRLTVAKAAHLFGVSEAALRRLAQRHAPPGALDGGTIDAGALRQAARNALAARRKG